MLKSLNPRYELVMGFLDIFKDLPNICKQYGQELAAIKASYESDLKQLDQKLQDGLSELATKLTNARAASKQAIADVDAETTLEVASLKAQVAKQQAKLSDLKKQHAQDQRLYEESIAGIQTELNAKKQEKEETLANLDAQINERNLALRQVNASIAALAASTKES